jgi:PPOX class probable F420-dependent enzyme
MGVKLTEDEINDFLENGHTLIMATIRKSGEPFLTPVWYVWMDGAFYVRTGEKSAKVGHLRRDPRACCMVEEGEAWVDLRAVVANCDAEILQDDEQLAKVSQAISSKYARFRMQSAALPDATRKHYSRGRSIIRMTPREGEVRSWYNRKIRTPGSEKPAAE